MKLTEQAEMMAALVCRGACSTREDNALLARISDMLEHTEFQAIDAAISALRKLYPDSDSEPTAEVITRAAKELKRLRGMTVRAPKLQASKPKLRSPSGS